MNRWFFTLFIISALELYAHEYSSSYNLGLLDTPEGKKVTCHLDSLKCALEYIPCTGECAGKKIRLLLTPRASHTKKNGQSKTKYVLSRRVEDSALDYWQEIGQIGLQENRSVICHFKWDGTLLIYDGIHCRKAFNIGKKHLAP